MGLRALGIIALAIASASPLQAATKSSPAPKLISGLGDVHHPVSTQNKQAQQFFDQGLKLVYGFNHEEARRSFEYAAKLDPQLAMAWWGVALTLGPNYNLPVDPEREKAGYDAVQRAISLQANASEPERAYINALAFRYSNDSKADLHQLDVAYRNATAKLVQAYPDDLDAATLYAESIMNLNPWKLWLPDGKPNEGTEEILAVLEAVLQRNPNHLGANHYYIHAIEASQHPERGLASAARLEKLAPSAGHLVHMPSHIYSRLGDHVASARRNEVAVTADNRFLALTKDQGVYPAMYYSHNIHFLAYANCMKGDFTAAKRAADQLAAHIRPHLKHMPEMEGFLVTPYYVLIAFERWNEVMKLPPPDASFSVTTAVWHFARVMALASMGKTADAEREQTFWKRVAEKVPPDTFIIELNTAGPIFKIHENLMAAAIARSRHEDKAAMNFLTQAIAGEDALNYAEPPSWYPPVRPMLGRMLLAANQPAEAEKVFRETLNKSRRYGVALAGLRDSLKAQKQDYEAAQVDTQLQEARKNVDAVSTGSQK